MGYTSDKSMPAEYRQETDSESGQSPTLQHAMLFLLLLSMTQSVLIGLSHEWIALGCILCVNVSIRMTRSTLSQIVLLVLLYFNKGHAELLCGAVVVCCMVSQSILYIPYDAGSSCMCPTTSTFIIYYTIVVSLLYPLAHFHVTNSEYISLSLFPFHNIHRLSLLLSSRLQLLLFNCGVSMISTM